MVRGGFGGKSITKIISDTERMKNTSIEFCTETFFVGRPSTEIKTD
jgi:hypothetical protein